MSDPKQDEVRAQFEAWATELEYDIRPMCDLREDFGDAYISPSTENVWRAWQAASLAASMRAASVARSHLGGGIDGAIHFIAEAIEADAGIKGDGR